MITLSITPTYDNWNSPDPPQIEFVIHDGEDLDILVSGNVGGGTRLLRIKKDDLKKLMKLLT